MPSCLNEIKIHAREINFKNLLLNIERKNIFSPCCMLFEKARLVLDRVLMLDNVQKLDFLHNILPLLQNPNKWKIKFQKKKGGNQSWCARNY